MFCLKVLNIVFKHFLENPARYTKCTITGNQMTVTKRMSSPHFISMRDLTVDDVEAVEIIWKSDKVFDSKPVQVGQCILQMAKLLLAKFVYWIDTHLEAGSFQLTYSDTDSIGIALTDTNIMAYKNAKNLQEKIDSIFLPIVKPGMIKSWEESYKNWFVIDDSVENQLKPGLLKCK